MDSYDKLICQFGTQRVDSMIHSLIPHHLVRRGIFYSHRDLTPLLTSGDKFYLYTGRGPSSNSLHLGHMVPLLMTKYLQDTFKAPLVIQMTNDEKFLFRDHSLAEINRMCDQNIRDMLAIGFDPQHTFIFKNTDYIQHLYPNVLQIEKHITANQVKAAFGLKGEDNIGKYSFPAIQAAPAFVSSFEGLIDQKRKCLIPCAIDQDPFFRLTRDVATKLHLPKPAVFHSKFLPALQGIGEKMSSSANFPAANSLFMSDTPKQLEEKIKKYAFSGGGATLKEHREKGANLNVDVPYAYLQVFLEDDLELAKIADDYGSGRMLTSEMKTYTSRILTEFVVNYQHRRNEITEDKIKQFMTIRNLEN